MCQSMLLAADKEAGKAYMFCMKIAMIEHNRRLFMEENDCSFRYAQPKPAVSMQEQSRVLQEDVARQGHMLGLVGDRVRCASCGLSQPQSMLDWWRKQPCRTTEPVSAPAPPTRPVLEFNGKRKDFRIFLARQAKEASANASLSRSRVKEANKAMTQALPRALGQSQCGCRIWTHRTPFSSQAEECGATTAGPLLLRGAMTDYTMFAGSQYQMAADGAWNS